MRANELIFHLVHKEERNPDELGKSLGLSGKNNVYQTIHGKDMKVSTLLRYADALGYDVLVQSRENGKQYVVDNSEEQSPFHYDFNLGLNELLRGENNGRL